MVKLRKNKRRGNEEPEKKLTYREQLEKYTASLNELVQDAIYKLEIGGDDDSDDSDGEPRKRVSPESVFGGLQIAVGGLIEELSEEHQGTAKEALKAQQVTFDMKLATTRKASASSLQNQACEMQGDFASKMEATMTALKSEGGSELREARAALEEMKQEFNGLKMKQNGLEEAMKMTQSLYNKSEAKSKDLAARLAKEQERAQGLEADLGSIVSTLEKAYNQLGLERGAGVAPTGTSLVERLHQMLGACDKWRVELDEARIELMETLTSLNVPVGEGSTLRDELRKLKASMSNDAERAELIRERDTLEAKRQELESERDAVSGERDSLLDERVGLQATIQELRDEIHAIKSDTSAARASTEKIQMLQAAMARLGDENARLKSELEAARVVVEPTSDNGHEEALEIAQERVAALEREGGGYQELLDEAFGELALERKGKPSMQEQLQILIAECKRTRASNETIEEGRRSLEAQLGETRAEIERLKSSDASAEAERWKRQTDHLSKEVERAEQRVVATIGVAAARAAGAGGGGGGSALPEMIEVLSERYFGLKTNLERTTEELEAITSSMLDMKLKVEQAQEVTVTAVREAHAEAKKERTALVSSALRSLESLRTHLIFSLCGLREAAAEPTEQNEYAFQPWQKRWGVQTSDGRFDQLVLRLKLPPASSPRNRGGPRGIMGRSPRAQRLSTPESGRSRVHPPAVDPSRRRLGGIKPPSVPPMNPGVTMHHHGLPLPPPTIPRAVPVVPFRVPPGTPAQLHAPARPTRVQPVE